MEMKAATQIVILLNCVSCCFLNLCWYALLHFEFDFFPSCGEGGQITQISSPCLKEGTLNNTWGLPECHCVRSPPALAGFWPWAHSLPELPPSPVLPGLRWSWERPLTCSLVGDTQAHRLGQDPNGMKQLPDTDKRKPWLEPEQPRRPEQERHFIYRYLSETANWPAHR